MASNLGKTIKVWDSDSRLSTVTGVACLMDDLIGRLSQKLWYDPNYGTIVELWINTTSKSLQQAKSDIENAVKKELMKDERVALVVATSFMSTATQITVSFDVTISTGATFTLIGSASSQSTTNWKWS